MNKSQSNPELREILSTLTEKEARVIIARFGIYDRDGQTLEQVGNGLGVTRERIRQIEVKALRKLRSRAQCLNAKLDDYLV